MNVRTFHLVLLMVVVLSSSLTYGQDSSPGAINKKPRTLEDYQPSTLKRVVGHAKRDGLVPFRVRVTYTASARPISTISKRELHAWELCCAGDPDHYKGYIREMKFVENGVAYWLAVEDGLIADLQKELKAGEIVDVFLIRLSPPQTKGSVLLVERFQRGETIDDQLKESVDSIRDHLLSSAEKDLKVEVSGPCQLKITDSSKTAGVSRAVVFLPLTDLDPLKISVLEGQLTPTWSLLLHTIAGKRSIRFMLYQGSPAEGGQANKYSLNCGDRHNTEAMAEAFRRAINLCASDARTVN